MISDLHLGEAGSGAHASRLERELVAFLDFHRDAGRRYHLVINGDMVDLVGVTVMPDEIGWVAGLHPDDHLYGLGARAHSAALKLDRVLARHEPVFRALGRFLAAGHDVAIVMGNHDAELHWPEVQQLLRDTLTRYAAESSDTSGELSFHPWFFFEDGLAWIEHGHQYDPYCSFEDVLEPTTDEEEIDPNLGALLPRYLQSRFVDPIHDAWGKGFWGYLSFWYAQGRERSMSILTAYLDVFRRLAEHWRSRVPERLAARRARARTRLNALASRLRLPEERLLELARLARPPIPVELGRIVQALMLDRLALLVFGPLVVLLPMLLLPWGWQPWALAVAAFPLGTWGWYAGLAREPVDPSAAMKDVARRIRQQMKVPIVVMGHSHTPHSEGDETGGYFNTGTWVAHEHAFTHLRIERTARGVRALLCQWRDGASRVFEPVPR